MRKNKAVAIAAALFRQKILYLKKYVYKLEYIWYNLFVMQSNK